MFQDWQVGAIYRQAACVCPPVCLLLDNTYLSGSLLNHLCLSDCQPFKLPLIVCPFVHVCVSVWIFLGEITRNRLITHSF